MLADISTPSHAGQLGLDILLPATARYELFEFIAAELPRWRDHPDRPSASAETTLTSQLCDHLNGAAYYSTTWSHVQFRTEVPDEVTGGRSTDLAAKPRGALLVIEGSDAPRRSGIRVGLFLRSQRYRGARAFAVPSVAA
jgi:hypothetical protein